MKNSVSDSQFWEVIKASTVNYSLAVNLFQERYEVKLTRSMIKKRAELQPERIKQIQDEYLDSIEDILFLSVCSQNPAEQIQPKDHDLTKKVIMRVLTREENTGMTLDEVTAKLESKMRE